jgi:hypothetical protein
MMKKFDLPLLGCAAFLLLAAPIPAFADDPVDESAVAEEPANDETVVSDSEVGTDEPAAVDEGDPEVTTQDYDPEIAQTGVHTPQPNERGGGKSDSSAASVAPSGLGGNGGINSDGTYKILHKGNKFYKIPIQ